MAEPDNLARTSADCLSMAQQKVTPDLRPLAGDATAEQIREAITHAAATAARIPAHHVERKARVHRVIDGWLTRLEQCESAAHPG